MTRLSIVCLYSTAVIFNCLCVVFLFCLTLPNLIIFSNHLNHNGFATALVMLALVHLIGYQTLSIIWMVRIYKNDKECDTLLEFNILSLLYYIAFIISMIYKYNKEITDDDINVALSLNVTLGLLCLIDCTITTALIKTTYVKN